ncbi:MAG TPA: Fur family transcriptional regulator [Dehalococcoidia bacterium]|nr:Fur family transcriptional regulator [Dehalococcoidia bacterium]
MALSTPERATVERILRHRGERLTRQREAVLAYLQSTDEHPDARSVYEQVSRELPQVSLGTIYRTLSVLRDAGLVQELKYGSVSRYDANIGGHDHAHCLECGRVQDIDRRDAPDLTAFAGDGFRVLSHRLEVYGICTACQAQGGASSR